MVLGKSVSKVLACVSLCPKSAYMIAKESGCSNSTTGAALVQLEKEGKVVREPLYNDRQKITVEGWKKAITDNKVKQ